MIVGNDAPWMDQKLLTNIVQANQWYKHLKEGRSYEAIANEAGISKRRVQQFIDLGFSRQTLFVTSPKAANPCV